VRAKKTRTPSRSVRYLLSADRRLQRLSLRKISARVKKTKRPARPAASSRVARPTQATPVLWAPSMAMLILGMMCVAGIVGLIAADQPSQQVEMARLDTIAPVSDPRHIVAPVANVAADSPVKTAVAKMPQPESQSLASITVTGCLERSNETFWLSDTSGTVVPKSRNWRSGFLKKRASRIELVDATHSLRLPVHVGQRVTATGALTNGDMQAHSLQRVASSCS